MPYRLIFEVIVFWLALVMALGFTLFVAAGGGSTELLDDGSIASTLAAGYLLVCGYMLGGLVGTVSHETGHMAAAMAVSMPVRVVSIGRGPVLFSGRIGETTFQLRWRFWPGGVTVLYPMLILRRFRFALYILGGVAGNAVVIALLIAGLKFFQVSKGFEWVLTGAIVRQMEVIARSLFPRAYAVEIEQRLKTISSDGLQLLEILRVPADGPTQIGQFLATKLRCQYGQDESAIFHSPVAPRIYYQLARQRWTDKTERDSADAALIRELKRGHLTAGEELLVLDILATDALLFEDPLLLSKLDEWTVRALALAPEAKTLRGTRGATLTQLKRYAEAKSLLEPLTLSEQAPPDGVLTHGFLARAEFALGDAAAARRHASKARNICDAGSHEAVIEAFVARIEVEVGLANGAIAPQAQVDLAKN